jgi:hypothetical protein
MLAFSSNDINKKFFFYGIFTCFILRGIYLFHYVSEYCRDCDLQIVSCTKLDLLNPKNVRFEYIKELLALSSGNLTKI